MLRILVCFAEEDKTVAEDLIRLLHHTNEITDIKVISELGTGEEKLGEIFKSIDVFIYLWSTNSKNHCQEEIQEAERLEIPILEINVDGTPIISPRQYSHLPAHEAAEFDRILTVIKQYRKPLLKSLLRKISHLLMLVWFGLLRLISYLMGIAISAIRHNPWKFIGGVALFSLTLWEVVPSDEWKINFLHVHFGVYTATPSVAISATPIFTSTEAPVPSLTNTIASSPSDTPMQLVTATNPVTSASSSTPAPTYTPTQIATVATPPTNTAAPSPTTPELTSTNTNTPVPATPTLTPTIPTNTPTPITPFGATGYITNTNYQNCLAVGNCEDRPEDPDRFLNPVYATEPILGLNWLAAKAYCDWIGKRLPNHSEWEQLSQIEQAVSSIGREWLDDIFGDNPSVRKYITPQGDEGGLVEDDSRPDIAFRCVNLIN